MSLSYTKSLGCLSYYVDRDQHLNKRECCAQLIYDIFNFMFNNLPCIRCKFYGILCHGTCRTCLYDDSGCPGHKLLFDVI